MLKYIIMLVMFE